VEELEAARMAAVEEWECLGMVDGLWDGPEEETSCKCVAFADSVEAALQASDGSAGLVADASCIADDSWMSAYEDERAAQVLLLREIAGDPFYPVAVEARWLAWNDSSVIRIAQSIYDEQTFDCMPILGDALEDAGCTDSGILDHLRGPGPHVR